MNECSASGCEFSSVRLFDLHQFVSDKAAPPVRYFPVFNLDLRIARTGDASNNIIGGLSR